MKIKLITRLAAALTLLGAMGLMVSPARAQEGVSVTLEAAPASGVESVTPTLTWSSTGAVTCEAAGGWSGTKPPQGTETLPAIDRSTDYSLTCSAADGWAQLTWTAPTQYTNGDPLPLSDLGGFKIYYGLAGGPLNVTVDVPDEAATTHRIDGLSAGGRDFAMTAYTDGGVESALSNSVTKVIEVAASEATAAVSVQLRPAPPVIVTVESVVYELKINPATQVASLGRKVGAIAYGVACTGDPMVTTRRGEYYAVPMGNVFVTKQPRSDVLVARCGLESGA